MNQQGGYRAARAAKKTEDLVWGVFLYLDHIVTIAGPLEGDLITNLECSTFGFEPLVHYVTILPHFNCEKYFYGVYHNTLLLRLGVELPLEIMIQACLRPNHNTISAK